MQHSVSKPLVPVDSRLSVTTPCINGCGPSQSMIGEIPYRIATSVGNRKLAAVCLNRYTMYRRAGFSVTRGTEDADLMKRNKSLYVFRMRIGGQLNHSDAAVVYEDGQT